VTPSAASPGAVKAMLTKHSGFTVQRRAVVIRGMPPVPLVTLPMNAAAAAASVTCRMKCRARSTRYPRRMVPWTSA